MRKLFLNILCICAVVCSLQAEQLPEQRWEARYTGPSWWSYAEAIAIDGVGNAYVTGGSYNGTNTDYTTIKYDPYGNQMWLAVYDGPAKKSDSAVAIVLDNSGNVYITGNSADSTGKKGYATVKYDPNGNQLWSARYDGSGPNNDCAYDLAVDDLGNVYVTGESWDANTTWDWATIKYDPNGSESWVIRYNGSGNSWDTAYDLEIDSLGDIYVVGYSYNNEMHPEFITAKYDPNGNQLWIAHYYDPEGSSYAQALTLDISGNLYVTGYTDFGSGCSNVTIKYDPNGDQIWIGRYQEPNIMDIPQALGVDELGNVFVTGRSNSVQGLYLTTICYDLNGMLNWIDRYPGPDITSSAHNLHVLDLDVWGNIYVTGLTGTSRDYTTIKYDTDGNRLWIVNYNGPYDGTDWPKAIAVNGLGDIWVTGKSYNGIPAGSVYATIKYTQHDYCIAPIESDFDSSCKVDFIDFAIMGESWLEIYDFNDLATLAEDWLKCNLALEEDCWQ